MTREQILEWMRRYAAAVIENKDRLTELDAVIGDADHGVNMERGMSEVLAKLPGLAGRDIAAILNGVGMTLLSKVGGASGPLYGTLFMRFSQEIGGGRAELNAEEFANGLAAGVLGVQKRGSAQPGEKTMIDALLPAVIALRGALAEGCDLPTGLQAAAAAAQAGAERTTQMQASKGRASYLGPRSIGHQDPGATSAHLLIEAAAEALAAAVTTQQERFRQD